MGMTIFKNIFLLKKDRTMTQSNINEGTVLIRYSVSGSTHSHRGQ